LKTRGKIENSFSNGIKRAETLLRKPLDSYRILRDYSVENPMEFGFCIGASGLAILISSAGVNLIPDNERLLSITSCGVKIGQSLTLAGGMYVVFGLINDSWF
jgi:hypothetical protein